MPFNYQNWGEICLLNKNVKDLSFNSKNRKEFVFGLKIGRNFWFNKQQEGICLIIILNGKEFVMLLKMGRNFDSN